MIHNGMFYLYDFVLFYDLLTFFQYFIFFLENNKITCLEKSINIKIVALAKLSTSNRFSKKLKQGTFY